MAGGGEKRLGDVDPFSVSQPVASSERRLYSMDVMQAGSPTDDAIDLEASPELGWDFEQAAIPFLDSLYNMAYRLSRNAEDAEVLVQETYF